LAEVQRSWIDRHRDLAALPGRQLFFVGGAPRSGTTWLQLLLDSHPEISCRGEGLFWKALAEPLDRLLAERRAALDAKNKNVFRERGGYDLPEQEDAEILLGTAILLAFERQSGGTPYRAIGEKTPENIFLFARLKRLFPAAKLIGLARDPRDVLTSAWHFFVRPKAGADEVAAKTAFIRGAIPSLRQGMQAMLALANADPSSCLVITYEEMHRATETVAAQLFRFLGVADDAATVADCAARTSFVALSAGRSMGVAADGAFFRKGIVGDWRSTLTPEMNELILGELGSMFPRFDWQP